VSSEEEAGECQLLTKLNSIQIPQCVDFKFAPVECEDGLTVACVLNGSQVKIFEIDTKFTITDVQKPVLLDVNINGCNCVCWDPDSNPD
jgi:hypothetical protein